MHFTLWWTVISVALFSVVRCDRRRVIHYAQETCHPNRDDSVTFLLVPSGWNSSTIIRATRFLSSLSAFNCNITVSAPNVDGGHVLLSVRKVNFPTKAGCTNYIKVYENNRSRRFCTRHDFPGRKVDFTDVEKDRMTFLYHKDSYMGSTLSFNDGRYSFKGFEVLATVYTKAPCGEELSFPCKNGRCISRELVFDGYDNCGDGSDESVFDAIRMTRGAIIGICIAILLVIAAISGTIYLVRRRRVTRVKTYTAASQIPAGAQQLYPQQTYAPYPQGQYGGVVNPNYGVQPPPYYQ